MPRNKMHTAVTAGFGTAMMVVVLLGLGGAVQAQDDRAGDDFFENHIRPVLVASCYECHSGQSKNLRGELRLDSREGLLRGGNSGPAVVPGDPEGSLLMRAVRQTDAALAMPPGKEGRKKLPDSAIRQLTEWVEMGAPFPVSETFEFESRISKPPHWSFQPIQNPPVPVVGHSTWPRSSVDPFILAKLKGEGIEPAPPADRRSLIRRVTYGLTGLPPWKGC
jgi:hypothetical protein